MGKYSHTGLLNWFEKIDATVQTILRGKEKGTESYLALLLIALKLVSFLTFVELNYTKVVIYRYICKFMNFRMSDTGSLSKFYETQFLEGLYIAVRTQGVPIYKVFLLLILFVYSFFILFYFSVLLL